MISTSVYAVEPELPPMAARIGGARAASQRQGTALFSLLAIRHWPEPEPPPGSEHAAGEVLHLRHAATADLRRNLRLDLRD